MSDEAVLSALQAMEALLSNPELPLDGTVLEAWNREFKAAVAGAEKGPEWQVLVARAHRLAEQVETHRRAIEAQRDAIRFELEGQARGKRALKGYITGLR
jgi:flagellar hook-associated protein FlgK